MSFIRSLRAPLRTLPTLSAIPKPAARPAFAFRAFSSTPLARAGGPAPPQLYGEGGKPGEIPTDEQQATGIERFELLGDLHGVDVFDMAPLEMTRMGTLDDPISIYTLHPTRLIGCTGFPADSHDTIWLQANVKTHDKHRCPECGCGLTPPTNNSRSSSPAGGGEAKPRIVSGSLRDRIARFENPAAAPLLPTHPFGTAGPAHPSSTARGGLVGNRIPSLDPKGAGMVGSNRKVSENKGLIGNRIPSGVSSAYKAVSSGRSASPAGSVDSSTASGAASGSPITSRSSSPPTSPGLGLPQSLLSATLPGLQDNGGPGAMTPSSTRADAGDELSSLSVPSTPVQAPAVPTGGHYDLVPPNLKLVEGQTPNAAQIALTRGLSTQSNAGSNAGSVTAPSLGSSRLSQYDPSSEGSENPQKMMQDVSGISTPTSTPKADRLQLEGSTRGSVVGEGSVIGENDMDDLGQRLTGLGMEGIDRDATPAPMSPAEPAEPAEETATAEPTDPAQEAEPAIEGGIVKATEVDGKIIIDESDEKAAQDELEQIHSGAAQREHTGTHPNDLPDPSKPSADEVADDIPMQSAEEVDAAAGPLLDADPNQASDLDDLKSGKLSHDKSTAGVHTVDQNPVNTIAETSIAQGFDIQPVAEDERKEQGGVAGQRMEDIEKPTAIEPPKAQAEQQEQQYNDSDDLDVHTATERSQSQSQSQSTETPQKAPVKDQMPDIIQGTHAAGVRLDDATGAGAGPLTSGDTDQLKEVLVEERMKEAERNDKQMNPSEGLQTEEDRDEGKSRREQLISALDQNKDADHDLQGEVDEESKAKARQVTEAITKDIKVDDADEKTEEQAEKEADEAKGGRPGERYGGEGQAPYESGEEGYGSVTKSLAVGLEEAKKSEGADAPIEAPGHDDQKAKASLDETDKVDKVVTSGKPIQVQIEPAPIAQPVEDKHAERDDVTPPASELKKQAEDNADTATPSTPPTFPTPPNVDPDVVDPVPEPTDKSSPSSTPIDANVLKSFPDVPDEEKPRVEVHVSQSPAASPAKGLRPDPETPVADIPGKSKSLQQQPEGATQEDDKAERSEAEAPGSGRSSLEVDATPTNGGAKLAKRGSTRRSPKSPLLDDEDPGDFEPGEGWAVVTKDRDRK